MTAAGTELAYVDIIVARSIGPATVNEVALRLARQTVGAGAMAIITGAREELRAVRAGTNGLDRVIRLIAVVGDERRLCLAVGHPSRAWARRIVARLHQPAVFCDGAWVLLLPDGSVEEIGAFIPKAIAASLARALGAETTFDALGQGHAQTLIEHHLRPEDVSDEQREALLERLRRLGG